MLVYIDMGRKRVMNETERMVKLIERIGLASARPNSPLSTWLCGTVTFADKGEVTVEYLVRKEMTDSFDQIHCGLLSLVQTEVAELMYFLVSGIEQQAVSNINNHFIRRINIGCKITVSAKSIPKQFSQEIETTIRDENGQIAAIGRISFQTN